ncbi:hypothetical protein BCU74_03915 [Vibrio breoganii]|uniref:hypothetical protein n=1 Tax=Vibrio breoganii TaxID=553239 RepID=UPI000C84A227|nr:hypothetical protein [Vibrio breoganii]PMH22243.1 hypothetical protein BCU74_03915 [Vibrio breoganii]
MENKKRERGRPKKVVLDNEAKELALKKLKEALNAGESWAVTLVVNRIAPPMKAIAPVGSAEYQLIKTQVKKAKELEDQFKEIKEALGI